MTWLPSFTQTPKGSSTYPSSTTPTLKSIWTNNGRFPRRPNSPKPSGRRLPDVVSWVPFIGWCSAAKWRTLTDRLLLPLAMVTMCENGKLPLLRTHRCSVLHKTSPDLLLV
uniref:Uncharacterized protein n=1 Tax=Cacopsylla melanoneura TaxID=428564 RepID=A0A8D8M9F8_9HEMI